MAVDVSVTGMTEGDLAHHFRYLQFPHTRPQRRSRQQRATFDVFILAGVAGTTPQADRPEKEGYFGVYALNQQPPPSPSPEDDPSEVFLSICDASISVYVCIIHMYVCIYIHIYKHFRYVGVYSPSREMTPPRSFSLDVMCLL